MKTLDLCGTWKLRWADGERGHTRFAERDSVDEARYIDAQVPGEVHLDLLRHGWIADPNLGTNALACRWVEDNIWSYRRVFDAPADACAGRAWLVFEGLDLAATVTLNGATVGTHANSFRPCRIEVTGKLKPGRNVLAVHVECGLRLAADKPGSGYSNSINHNYQKRHWLRKPQCQFGWDWSPRLINVGIHKPARLEWTDAPARVEQVVPLVEVTPDLAAGRVRVRAFVEGLGAAPVKGRLTARIPAASVVVETGIEVRPGVQCCEVELQVPNPRLWWPVGHGLQHLYELQVQVQVEGREIAQRTLSIGFRRVRVNQEPHPDGGRFFVLEVNNRRIFCKGGNFVPADLVPARIDRKRYDRLTDLALESNFNMLRVWGGGLYESDDFYELCDRKGLLVWQEFVFACSRYPGDDEAFMRDIKEEARFNLRRLAPHPSLVVWCGNNENEWGNWDWSFDKGRVHPDYALFHLTLPRLVAEEDPTRYYQPSSPFSPDLQHPNADVLGDQHPWTVGFGDTDFRKYRAMACRFPNEGGILGPTSLPTMRECLEGAADRSMTGLAWHTHENSVAFWEEPAHPDRMLEQWLGRDVRAMNLEEYVYWAGLVQAEGLREYIDNFRRRMFDTASAIFWMYNDCWPATRSWTTVDYSLRRTPAFHPVRRAFAPVSVVLAEEGDKVVVFGINETQSCLELQLRFGVMELAGAYPVDRSVPVTLPANASTRLAQFDRAEWRDPARSAAFAVLTCRDEVVARNRLFLPFFKEIQWPAVGIQVTVEKPGTVTFRCPTFAWGVCLDLDGGPAPADNFFDLYPGMPWTIPWQGKEPPRVLRVGNLV